MATRYCLTTVSLVVFLSLASCGGTRTDSALTDSVKASFFNDPSIKTEAIQITADKGEVTLAGEVSSEETRQQAISLVQNTPGVTKVHDSLQVKPKLAEADTLQPVPAAPTPSPAPVVPSSTAPAPAPAAKAPAASAPTASTAPPSAPAVPPSAPAASNAAASNAPKAPPPPPEPKRIVVPEGTSLQVLTIDAIDSDKSKIGSSFLAALYAPITVGDAIVVPKDANVYIKLMDASNSGKFKGKSELQLALDSVEFQGKRYSLQSSTYQETGKSEGKNTAKKVGIGAAVGTAIGAIAGGGKGAAIGAGVGAGAGVATQAMTHGEQVRVPSETRLDFKLEKPVEITIQPGRGKD